MNFPAHPTIHDERRFVFQILMPGTPSSYIGFDFYFTIFRVLPNRNLKRISVLLSLFCFFFWVCFAVSMCGFYILGDISSCTYTSHTILIENIFIECSKCDDFVWRVVNAMGVFACAE